MGGIADTQKPRFPPRFKSVDAYAQEMNVIPCAYFVHSVRRQRRDFCNSLAECIESSLPDIGKGLFAEYITALPVVTAIDHDETLSRAAMAHRIGWVIGNVRQLHPENFAWRAKTFDLQTGFCAHHGVSSVRTHNKFGIDIYGFNWCCRDEAGNTSVPLGQIDHTCRHKEPEV